MDTRLGQTGLIKWGIVMTRFFLSGAVVSAISVSLLKPTFALPIINANRVTVAAHGTDDANLVHWYSYRGVNCNLRVPCPLRHVHHAPDFFYGYWRPGRRTVSCNLRVPCPYEY
jgi:hypothetical protein